LFVLEIEYDFAIRLISNAWMRLLRPQAVASSDDRRAILGNERFECHGQTAQWYLFRKKDAELHFSAWILRPLNDFL